MFFEDHEKRIYTPNVIGSESRQYDPIRLDNLLTIMSKGKLPTLLADAQPDDGKGDVSVEGKRERSVARAAAEMELAAITRKAFDLPSFPECTDALALEHLYDYLEYMSKKGMRLARTPQSDEPSPGVSPESPSTVKPSLYMRSPSGNVHLASPTKPIP